MTVRYVAPAAYSEMSVEQLKSCLIRQLSELDTLLTRCTSIENFEVTWAGTGDRQFNRLLLVSSGRSPIGVDLDIKEQCDGKPLKGVQVALRARLSHGTAVDIRVVDSLSNIPMPGCLFEVKSHIDSEFTSMIPYEAFNRIKGAVRLEPEARPFSCGDKVIVSGFACSLIYGS